MEYLFSVRRNVVCVFLLLAIAFYSCENEDMQSFEEEIETKNTNKIIPGQYVVVLKDESVKVLRDYGSRKVTDRAARMKGYEDIQASLRTEIQNSYNLKSDQLGNVYSAAIVGFSAKLDQEELSRLQEDERVDFIEQDFMVELDAFSGISPIMNYILLQTSSSGQTTPWGITEIGGAVNAAGLNRWAFVIDSGIQLDHPDLNVNSQYGRSFVSGYSSPTDQNGHGTHVAGTIAAINNSFGVIGVAAGATVVPVRVFGPTGGSPNSVIISGIDYTAQVALANDVANMSFGGPASTATDNAVKNLAAKGVFCAIAAGNEAQNANNVSPARATGSRLFTVSAYDSKGVFASFSNFGNPPIVVSAPGVNINSTWIGSGYRAINGTSMATPHVAGILLANNGTVRWSGTVTNDPDGTPDRKARR